LRLRGLTGNVDVPFIELHVSNVHAREPWRHHSYFSDKAAGIIVVRTRVDDDPVDLATRRLDAVHDCAFVV
jgi:hypothetical protein